MVTTFHRTFILGPRGGRESKSANMSKNHKLLCNMLLTVGEIKHKAKLLKYKTN